MKQLIVKIEDKESRHLPQVLGIDKKREEELDVLVASQRIKSDNIADLLCELSKQVKNANELVYVVFHAGTDHVEKQIVKVALSSGGLFG